jgi:hypothetical protein
MLSKNILTILRCGIRSHGEGHTVGFDPAGGATSESQIPWEGPHRRVQSPGRGHSGKSDPAGGATAESPIPRKGPQRKVRSLSLSQSQSLSLPMSLSLSSPKRVNPAVGAAPYDLIPRGGHTVGFDLRQGPHRRIRSPGGGHIVGFDPAGGATP